MLLCQYHNYAARCRRATNQPEARWRRPSADFIGRTISVTVQLKQKYTLADLMRKGDPAWNLLRLTFINPSLYAQTSKASSRELRNPHTQTQLPKILQETIYSLYPKSLRTLRFLFPAAQTRGHDAMNPQMPHSSWASVLVSSFCTVAAGTVSHCSCWYNWCRHSSC